MMRAFAKCFGVCVFLMGTIATLNRDFHFWEPVSHMSPAESLALTTAGLALILAVGRGGQK